MSIGTIWNHRDFIKREYGEEHATEFERIVKKYQAEQISIEQDRIIKLLEVDAERQTQYCKPLNAEHCHSCFESVRLIALIKGENK